MKMVKRFLCMMLVLAFTMPVLSISTEAASSYEIMASDYIATTGIKNLNFNNYDSFVVIGSEAYVEYKVNTSTEAIYHIMLRVAGGDGRKLSVEVNGNKILSRAVPSSSVGNVYGGEAKFISGENRLRITFSGDLSSFYSISLQMAAAKSPTFVKTKGAFKNHFIPCKIEAEDFDLKGCVTSEEKKNIQQDYRNDSPFTITKELDGCSVLINGGDSMIYTFNVTESGVYNLKVKTQADGALKIQYDGKKGYIIADTYGFEESNAGSVYLEKGKHTVYITAIQNDTEIDFIKFYFGDSEYISMADLSKGEVFVVEREDENTDNPVWKEFYVSPSGNDKNSGTKERPFLTINGAKEAVAKISDEMKGDIIVNVLPGTYNITEKMTFTEKDSGKNGFNIIYRGSDSADKPVIDGGVKITGWEKLNDKIWTAPTGDIKEVRQLYVNGFMAQRARSKYRYVASRIYDNPETECKEDGFYVSKINFPIVTNAEDMECVFNLFWTNQRVAVAQMTELETEYLVVYDQPYFSYAITRAYEHTAPLSGKFFYIEGCPELIDEPGEFCFDRDKKLVYYYPFAEEDMSTAEVYTGVSEGMIYASGSSEKDRVENITFDNMEFRHGAWNDVSRTGVSFIQADSIVPQFDYSATAEDGATLPTQVQIDNADNINITNCIFTNLGSSAIGFIENVKNSSACGNVIHDIAGTGVTVGHWRYKGDNPELLTQDYVTRKIDVSDNVIRRVGQEFYGCVGIGVYYSNSVTVANNDIEELPYTGITLGWGWGDEISNTLKCANHRITDNRIVNVMCTVLDGGPIYTLGEMKGTVISGNYCKSNGNDYGGIYFDSGSKSITAFNNVLENSQSAFFGGPDYSDVWNIYNNYTNVVDKSDYTQWNKLRRTDEMTPIVERPIRTHGNNWGAEAKEIIKNAGVSEEYKQNLEGIERPSWRTNFLTTSAGTKFYISSNIIEVISDDYVDGGEGVGYHKNTAGQEPQVFTNESGIVAIGATLPGEWMNYEIEVKESGEYSFELFYSLAFDGTEANAATAPKASVHIDKIPLADAAPLANTKSWSTYQGQNIGTVFLAEGKHIVRVGFVDGGYSYWKFRLIKENQYANDESFDDGIMFKPRELED